MSPILGASRRAAAVLSLALVSAGTVMVAASPAMATSDSITLTGTTPQAWVVPPTIHAVTLTAIGGTGGHADPWDGDGGAGAIVTETIPVTPGDVLHVRVGGHGARYADGAAGGANGGGAGGGGGGGGGVVFGGGGGGGATDVRIGGDGLEDRVLVAAGGGGGGFGTNGGAAGQPGSVGCSGIAAEPGTSIGGGTGGPASNCGGDSGGDGVIGVGGDGASRPSNASGGGGGGGGLYGGGGGNVYGGGAGGSSYTSPDAIDTSVALAESGTEPSLTIDWVQRVVWHADAETVPADGTSTVGLDVLLTDAHDVPMVDAEVALAADLGTVSAVTEAGGGHYTATFTAPISTGVATISLAVAGSPEMSDEIGSITVVKAPQQVTLGTPKPGPVSAGSSWTPGAIGSGTGLAGTVSLGSATTHEACAVQGGVVTFHHLGTCVVDIAVGGDARYLAGSASYSIVVDSSGRAAHVVWTPVTGSPVADGASTAGLDVLLTDADGNAVPGDDVGLSADLGWVSPVIDKGDGHYAATYTAPVSAGLATISLTDDDSPAVEGVVGTITVGLAPQHVTLGTAEPGPVSAGTSWTPGATGSGTGLAGTVSLGSATTPGACAVQGGVVSFHHLGTCVVDIAVAGNARYSSASASYLIVVDSSGRAAHVAWTTVTAALVADGVATAQLQVALTDADGNAVPGDAVVLSADLGSVSAVTDRGDGRYTATYTAPVRAGLATITLADVSSPAVAGVVGTFTVGLASQHLTLGTAKPDSAPVGSLWTPTATGSGTGLAAVVTVAAGTTNDACAVNAGTVTFAHVGTCVVTITAAENQQYAVASASYSTTVGVGATSTGLVVSAGGLTATVTQAGTSAGAPTGSVEFTIDGASVGTVELNDGVATLERRIPAGRTVAIKAAYLGSADFAASETEVARRDPRITARISSAAGAVKGWYRRPVQVTFACTAGSAALTASCPTGVTLGQGRNQSVTRTVSAVDGGSATVKVSGINVDLTAPTVTITGSRSAKVKCVAKDTLSGVASCRITKTKVKNSKVAKVKVVATATDHAGNVTRATKVVKKR
jgi:hypothetical protein